MRKLFCFLLIGFLFACSSKDPFKRLDRLNGLWQTHNSETDLYEEWKKEGRQRLQGKSYTMNGTDSIVFERVQISREDDGIYYTATVKDQNQDQPVQFKLIAEKEYAFTFENKQHDFPQRVIYRFVGRDSLVARIEGINKGEAQSQEFYYHRVK